MARLTDRMHQYFDQKILHGANPPVFAQIEGADPPDAGWGQCRLTDMHGEPLSDWTFMRFAYDDDGLLSSAAPVFVTPTRTGQAWVEVTDDKGHELGRMAFQSVSPGDVVRVWVNFTTG